MSGQSVSLMTNIDGVSCPVNMVPRTAHTQSALEISSIGHVYEAHDAGCLR